VLVDQQNRRTPKGSFWRISRTTASLAATDGTPPIPDLLQCDEDIDDRKDQRLSAGASCGATVFELIVPDLSVVSTVQTQ
jgi:hypothetical protein